MTTLFDVEHSYQSEGYQYHCGGFQNVHPSS